MNGVTRAAWGSALVAVLVFLPSLWNGFAYDDVSILVENEALHDLGNLPELLTKPYWPGGEGESWGLWRPLSTASLALLWASGDGAPWVFHLANVLLHGAVSALVALLAGALLSVPAAWIGGLLFAVHPVHVEAVANGIGFAELLSAALSLAACLVLVRRPAGSPLDGRTHLILALLFGLAVLAKENAAVLPGLLVILEWWRERTSVGSLGAYLRRRGVLLASLTGVLVATLVLRAAVLGAVLGGDPPLGAEWLAEAPRIWTMAAVWIDYLRLLIWPVELSPDYTPPVVALRHGWDAASLAGLTLVLALLGGAWWATRRPSPAVEAVPPGLLWFVVAMLPVSNLVFLSGVLLAERTLYLPSVGPALIAGAAGAALLARRRTLGLAVSAAALVLLAGRSISYTPVWDSQTSVFEYMLAEVPESARSRWATADLLLGEGRDSLALTEYRRTVSHLGESYAFLTRSGARLADAGHAAQGRALFRRAWQVDSTRIDAPRRLAILANARGDADAVIRWTGAALERDDTPVELWHLRAGSLAGLARWEESAEARAELLERGERQAWQQWAWLAEARLRAGALPGGRAALDSARARGAPDEARARLEALADSVAGAG